MNWRAAACSGRGLAVAILLAGSSSAAAQSGRWCPQVFGTENVQHCGWGWSDDARRAAMISLLVGRGLFHPSEFDGVRIAWCSLAPLAEGTAVNAGLVYLDTGTLAYPLERAAAALAHEMVHVRQYRRLGQDGFLYAYRLARLRCGCCANDARLWLEREALAMEARVGRVARSYGRGVGRVARSYARRGAHRGAHRRRR
jgi:hypothetical protein